MLTNLTNKQVATHLKESGISNFKIIGKTRAMSVTLLNELSGAFPNHRLLISGNSITVLEEDTITNQLFSDKTGIQEYEI